MATESFIRSGFWWSLNEDCFIKSLKFDNQQCGKIVSMKSLDNMEVEFIDAHREWRGKGDGKYRTHQANVKTLDNKNAIKPKIGWPLHAIFPESLDPPLGILAKTSGTPSPGFSIHVHLWFQMEYICTKFPFSTTKPESWCLGIRNLRIWTSTWSKSELISFFLK
jgi:hypothetical protein